jgi:phosphate:Na+ symporter
MGTTVLLNLVGGIALLLWGMHMVQSGILRAFGADLRRVLAITLRNRFAALLAGIGATALLQSSTATALMTATFLGDGLVGLVPALAIMLGANIGTTLIVQVFSFDVSMLAPVLLGIGVIVFKNSVRTKIRDLGRVAIGLGLMLLSLHMLLDTLAPAESAPNVRALLTAITAMPVLNVIFGAALAWAAHSSVAVVLLVISLAYSNFITPVVALALVLGANLGSAINPMVEGGSLGNPIARRLPLGNLINRAPLCCPSFNRPSIF